MINEHKGCGGQWGIIKTPVQHMFESAEKGMIAIKCWRCKEIGFTSEVNEVHFKRFEDIKPNLK